MSVAQDVSRMLGRELAGFTRELDLFPDEPSVWQTAPGITNSAGNLVLHVAGNLQYFVGSVLGGTSYRRDRDHEFGARSVTRQELISQLEAAARVVQDVLSRLTPEDLDRDFPEPVGGTRMRTGLFLIHLAAHAAYHLGQTGYLRRALTSDARTSGALPLKTLVG